MDATGDGGGNTITNPNILATGGSDLFVSGLGTDNAFRIANVADSGLPVELSSFSVKAKDSSAFLLWETSSETNNAGFEVESWTAGQPWQSLGFVEGHGTSLEAQRYTFSTENLSPGTHRFRLKQIDFDGSFEYSSELELSIEILGAYQLSSNYPNPFNPSTQFSLTLARDQKVQVDVVDITGQQVRTIFNGVLEAEINHQMQFNAGDLPSGVYVIRARGEDFVATRSAILVE